jgi:hypothetical protein
VAAAVVVAAASILGKARRVPQLLHLSDALYPLLRERLVPEMLHRSWR